MEPDNMCRRGEGRPEVISNNMMRVALGKIAVIGAIGSVRQAAMRVIVISGQFDKPVDNRSYISD
jgi:hypothetical protein